MTIQLQNHQFEIIHHTNSKIKKVTLVFESSNKITIKTPKGYKPHHLRDIFHYHQDWILANMNKIPSKNKFDFVMGGVVPFFGEKYELDFIEDEKYKNVKFYFDGNKFFVFHNKVQTVSQLLKMLKH